MISPLISDATFAKVVRLTGTFAVAHEDRWRLIAAVINNRLADALDDVRREDPENANLIEALEEANDEAARAYYNRHHHDDDRRDAEDGEQDP